MFYMRVLVQYNGMANGAPTASHFFSETGELYEGTKKNNSVYSNIATRKKKTIQTQAAQHDRTTFWLDLVGLSYFISTLQPSTEPTPLLRAGRINVDRQALSLGCQGRRGNPCCFQLSHQHQPAGCREIVISPTSRILSAAFLFSLVELSLY